MDKLLRLTKTGTRENSGLHRLLLQLLKDGREVGRLSVTSGQPTRQNFRVAQDPNSESGSMEPIPEGEYTLGPVEWRGRPYDWSRTWGEGLGALWVAIRPTVWMSRGDFGFHLDSNRSYSPGSAGCVVFADQGDAETFAGWMAGTPPRALVVDWELGTAPPAPTPNNPNPVPASDKLRIPFWFHSGGSTLRLPMDAKGGDYELLAAQGWLEVAPK